MIQQLRKEKQGNTIPLESERDVVKAYALNAVRLFQAKLRAGDEKLTQAEREQARAEHNKQKQVKTLLVQILDRNGWMGEADTEARRQLKRSERSRRTQNTVRRLDNTRISSMLRNDAEACRKLYHRNRQEIDRQIQSMEHEGAIKVESASTAPSAQGSEMTERVNKILEQHRHFPAAPPLMETGPRAVSAIQQDIAHRLPATGIVQDFSPLSKTRVLRNVAEGALLQASMWAVSSLMQHHMAGGSLTGPSYGPTPYGSVPSVVRQAFGGRVGGMRPSLGAALRPA